MTTINDYELIEIKKDLEQAKQILTKLKYQTLDFRKRISFLEDLQQKKTSNLINEKNGEFHESLLNEEIKKKKEIPFSGHIPSNNENISETENKLKSELISKNIQNSQFFQVPKDYYEKDLDYRCKCLNAMSKNQLCKTLLMENTKIDDNTNNLSKYFMIIIQYNEEKLHTEKLNNIVYKNANGLLTRKLINMRLTNEELARELTGFGYNAISPIGSKYHFPILISHKIAELEYGFFYIGAGEVYLKVALGIEEFIKAYNVQIVDCTYN